MDLGTGNGPMTASESAAADLASATLNAFATATLDSHGNGGISSSYAQAEFWDALSFHIPGAGAADVTHVQLEFTANGAFTGRLGCRLYGAGQPEGGMAHGGVWLRTGSRGLLYTGHP